jgi:3-oxoacyl-(acyl-carrier-protein) synthase
MSEYAKLTLAAAGAACKRAGLEPGSPALQEAHAILGTTQGATNFCEAYYGQIVREGIEAANPALFAEGVPNAAAAHLGMTLGLRGCCQTIIGTRSAGLDAFALAALRVRDGRAARVIVSAAEEYSRLVRDAYAACGRVCFTGAGAVALVVEGRRAAMSRGANILASIQEVEWRRDACEDQASCLRSLPELFSVAPLATLAAQLSAGIADRVYSSGPVRVRVSPHVGPSAGQNRHR